GSEAKPRGSVRPAKSKRVSKAAKAEASRASAEDVKQPNLKATATASCRLAEAASEAAAGVCPAVAEVVHSCEGGERELSAALAAFDVQLGEARGLQVGFGQKLRALHSLIGALEVAEVAEEEQEVVGEVEEVEEAEEVQMVEGLSAEEGQEAEHEQEVEDGQEVEEAQKVEERQEAGRLRQSSQKDDSGESAQPAKLNYWDLYEAKQTLAQLRERSRLFEREAAGLQAEPPVLDACAWNSKSTLTLTLTHTRLDELIQAKSAAEKQLAEGPVTARRRISRVGSDLDMNIALVKEEMEIRKAEAEKEQAKIDAFRLVWAIGNQQCGEWRNIDKYGNRLGAAAEIEPIAGVRKLSITKLEASDEANTRERRFLASLQGVGSSIRAQKLLRRLQRRRERAAEGGESRDLALEEEGESTSIATLLAKLRIPTGGDPFSSVTRTQSRRQIRVEAALHRGQKCPSATQTARIKSAWSWLGKLRAHAMGVQYRGEILRTNVREAPQAN
ncbi:MAG: hypothetical protein SGPRY_000406, partial [Prymnesium sp.]